MTCASTSDSVHVANTTVIVCCDRLLLVRSFSRRCQTHYCCRRRSRLSYFGEVVLRLLRSEETPRPRCPYPTAGINSSPTTSYQSISFHTPFISPSPIDSFRPFLDLSLSAYNAHFHKPFLLYRTDYLPFQGPISRRLPSVVLLFQRNISVQL